MKQLFRILFLFSFSWAQAQMVLPGPNSVIGSLLCEEPVQRVTTFPASVRDRHFLKKEVQSNPSTLHLSIQYFFQSDSGQAIQQDTTELNSYFAIPDTLLVANYQTSWNLTEYFYLDGEKVDSIVGLFANPYAECFSVASHHCQEVTVYRKRLVEICPSIYLVPRQRSYVFLHDTVKAIFEDSWKTAPYFCDAIGFRLQTDSVVVPDLLDSVLNVSAVSQIRSDLIECVTTPCPSPLIEVYHVKDLGKATWKPCFPNGALEGSLLCGEPVRHFTFFPTPLRFLTFLKKEIHSDTVNQIITLSYFFSDQPNGTNTCDTIVLNPYFKQNWFSGSPFRSQWEIRERFYVDSVLVDTLRTLSTPQAPCAYAAQECNKIVVYKKQLLPYCTSTFPAVYNASLYGDSLVAIFHDSLYSNRTVCVDIWNGYVVKVDSIIVTEGLPSTDQILSISIWQLTTAACKDTLCIPRAEEVFFQGTLHFLACLNDGLSEDLERPNLTPYPNPASGSVYLPQGLGTLTLTDVYGKQYLREGDGNYSLAGIQAGVYTLTYRVNGIWKNEKLVVL